LLGKYYEAILADFGFSAKSVSDIYEPILLDPKEMVGTPG
jgi:hypothetical protein